jgi:hypothetical protein
VTLLQMWQQQLTIHQATLTAAQTDMAQAQARLQTAKAQLAADQQTLAAMDAQIAAARASLATTTVPADAQALVAQITAMIIARRTQQGSVLDDQDAAAEAQAAADLAAARVASATDRVKNATTAIASITPDDAKRQSLQAAVASPPLSTMKSDATAYNGGATVTHANTRIGKNFPTALLTLAADRRATRTARIAQLQTDVANAETALGTELHTDTALAGASALAAIAFDQAQDALEAYVSTAANRFAKAQAVMAALEAIELAPAGTVPDVLTDAEKAQMTALTAAGATAQTTAVTLDTDQQGVFTAEDALAAQYLTSINGNVDGLLSDATIATRRAAVATAAGTFHSALATFAGANKKDLDAWEAVVPDTAWSALLDYLNAQADLAYLAGQDPAALVTALNTTEAAYATALSNQFVAERRVDALSQAVDFREALLDATQSVLPTRLLSAIRGDSY